MTVFTLRPMTCWLLVAGMLAVAACGGGGGEGGGAGGLRPAAIDNDSAERAVAIVSSYGGLVELKDNIAVGSSRAGRGGSPGLVSHLLTVFKTHALSSGPPERGGVVEGRHSCESGSITIDSQWVGPQMVSSCDQVSNFKSTLSLDGCTEGEWYANGIVILRQEGDLCTPTAVYLQFDQVDFDNRTQETTLSMADLRLHYSDLDWSGAQLTGMSVTVNGDASTTHTDLQAESNSFSLQLRNYRLALEQVDEGTVSMNVSGAVSGYCLDGWISLQTIEPLVYPKGSQCPLSGILRVSGEGEAMVTFAGGAIEIKVNTAAPYTISCEQLSGMGC
jgi:hypothetical protein